ncbi:hypothetical protein HC031_31895 [Planosporangium thailandense]|uniref:Uncharacterized protein n=1 Tax=Planosporangium thailandense TaxID=765197 RepID=A0ABX0Y8C8_9ACTN|nr:DUF5995 family protein [Planosporangium thailandense]NJC74283.1 hypothetical protein [Planosporangium thailandense]
MGERIAALITRMGADLDRLRAADDPRRFFHATYLRTTVAVAEAIDRSLFADPAWLERLDVEFADLYLRALDADRAGGPVPAPWRLAFAATRGRRRLAPVHHVLLGMNAHINYDLPQALLAVIDPAEFDDAARLAARAADHGRVDEILVTRVDAEDTELTAVSKTTALDRLLRPANRAATRRFLTEARAKVWANTTILDRIRRSGPDRYASALSELEDLCADRVRDLTAPGPVLLRLARRGFGVVL